MSTRRLRTAAAGFLLAAAALSACSGEPSAPSATASTASTASAPLPAPVSTGTPLPSSAPLESPNASVTDPTSSATPTRVVAAPIGLDAEVVATDVRGGDLVVPDSTLVAGWSASSAVPGDVGPSVIVGHVDGAGGPAVFYDVEDLAPGDAVSVALSDGRSVGYVVERVKSYEKAELDLDAVFGTVTGSELRLVTCGGVFDRRTGHYEENVVAFAREA